MRKVQITHYINLVILCGELPQTDYKSVYIILIPNGLKQHKFLTSLLWGSEVWEEFLQAKIKV
jgi:hypothetical protein